MNGSTEILSSEEIKGLISNKPYLGDLIKRQPSEQTSAACWRLPAGNWLAYGRLVHHRRFWSAISNVAKVLLLMEKLLLHTQQVQIALSTCHCMQYFISFLEVGVSGGPQIMQMKAKSQTSLYVLLYFFKLFVKKYTIKSTITYVVCCRSAVKLVLWLNMIVKSRWSWLLVAQEPQTRAMETQRVESVEGQNATHVA